VKRTVFKVASLVVLVSGAGCRVGPNYQIPTLPQGAESQFISRDFDHDGAIEPPNEWWTLYEDPALDRYLREAFLANFDIKAAEADILAAHALLAVARSGHYPQTGVQLGATRGRDAATDEILELQGAAPKTTLLLEDVFQVNYELDLWGRVHRAVEAASADAEAVAAARDSVKIIIAAETTRAYVLICGLGEQLAVASHSLEVVTREETITTGRHEAGANSNFDVVRAKGLVAQVGAAIPPLQGQRQAAILELAALLGRTPSEAPQEAANCVTTPKLNAVMPVGNGASLLKRRPDVHRADRRLAATTAKIGVATADLYPKVTLAGLYGGVGFSGADLAHSAGLAWGIGPSVSWAFPNQSVPRARIMQAKANATAALASFDSTVLTALKEVEQSLALYSSELGRHQSLRLAQSKALEAFDLASDMFLAGSLSNLELLTTEQTLIAADAAVAGSDAAIGQNEVGVFKALGGGWQSILGPK
jgi:NodT family efflux transporter outer membrane factor (OMF) lipoprotein